MQRSVVIVQARAGSTRLPGKVLMELQGKTVLERVLERCSRIERIAQICCAVPVGTENDAVGREAERCAALVVRGSETDVLDRYRQAAEQCRADVVVRVTSDCPLIDPAIVSQVLGMVLDRGADYASNNMPRTWPHGLDCEAFSWKWLERAAREAELPAEREHVTPYLRAHPEVKKMNLPGPGGAAARQRWTLDTSADLKLLRVLFQRIPEGPAGFDFRVPLRIVEQEPELVGT